MSRRLWERPRLVTAGWTFMPFAERGGRQA
jgi:hypothetical protein